MNETTTMQATKGFISTFPEILRESLQHGDQDALAKALNIPHQYVHDYANGKRRLPVEAAAIIVETLRRSNNPNSDALFLRLARRLGYATYRVEGQQIDDVDFAALLRDFSDVVNERARAEADQIITADERRAIAARLDALINGAVKYRDEQLVLAEDHEPTPVRRTA